MLSMEMTPEQRQHGRERKPGDVHIHSDMEYAFTLSASQIVEINGRFYFDITEEVIAARELDAK